MTILCKLHGVSFGGYYAWRCRPESDRAIEDGELVEEIKRIFNESKQTYGSPRICIQLRNEGFVVGENRIARLMRENGLRAVAEHKNKSKPWKLENYSDAKNLIRELELTDVDQVWLTDITYLKVNGVHQYMATILDLYSRRLLVWSIGPQKNCALTKRVLKKALKLRKPTEKPIIHSDRGSEFLGEEFSKFARKAIKSHSVNRKKSMNDNAWMEHGTKQ